MFLACDTIPRFLSFCMDICGCGENLFLCSLGEWTYSYRAALPMSPASPFIGGTPPALLPPALFRQTATKKYPRPSFFICSPSPVFACCRFCPAPSAPPGSACSAPFPAAAALPLVTISLNTYLAKHKFTHYRSFATASGYSASILYPHRSPLRL